MSLHDGPLRVYDAFFYEDRARLVIESKEGGGLVRYDFDSGELRGPSPHEIANPTQLDSLLLDTARIDFGVVSRLAERAPGRMRKPAADLHSISMHRTGAGLVWAVSFADGAACRYTLRGEETR